MPTPRKNKMNKTLTLISLLLFTFFFAACQKESKTTTQTTDPQQLMKELLQPRPKLDLTKDYTNDLSGQWSWVAKNVQNQQEIGRGQFIFLQKGRQIIGINQIQSGMEGILPKGVKITNVSNAYLKGTRQGNDSRLQFNIKGNGLNIDNAGEISNKGQSFKGRGFSILSNDGGMESNKFAELEYIWEATRTSG